MYKVLLRNNETGEERFVESTEEWGESSKYLWTEGNFQCDCNRHLIFEMAAGVVPEDDECECGDERYTALYAELPDGTRYELDDM